MMYEELVKRCRDCIDCLCGECKYKHLQKPGNFVPCMNALLGETANAIEELLTRVDGCENCKIAEEWWSFVHSSVTQKWISVTERLPENAGVYLCRIKSFDGEFRYTDTMKYVDGFFYERGVATDRITHWMPLPQLPEEGE